MIDHITLPVSDYKTSKAFYQQVLATVGYRVGYASDEEKSCGFRSTSRWGNGDLWIKEDKEVVRRSRYCIAFKARNKEQVAAFHQTGLDVGGENNGAPGYRPEYGTGYYAAFVFDPDGYNIEAVFDENV